MGCECPWRKRALRLSHWNKRRQQRFQRRKMCFCIQFQCFLVVFTHWHIRHCARSVMNVKLMIHVLCNYAPGGVRGSEFVTELSLNGNGLSGHGFGDVAGRKVKENSSTSIICSGDGIDWVKSRIKGLGCGGVRACRGDGDGETTTTTSVVMPLSSSLWWETSSCLETKER